MLSKRTIIISIAAIIGFVAAIFSTIMDHKPGTVKKGPGPVRDLPQDKEQEADLSETIDEETGEYEQEETSGPAEVKKGFTAEEMREFEKKAQESSSNIGTDQHKKEDLPPSDKSVPDTKPKRNSSGKFKKPDKDGTTKETTR